MSFFSRFKPPFLYVFPGVIDRDSVLTAAQTLTDIPHPDVITALEDWDNAEELLTSTGQYTPQQARLFVAVVPEMMADILRINISDLGAKQPANLIIRDQRRKDTEGDVTADLRTFPLYALLRELTGALMLEPDHILALSEQAVGAGKAVRPITIAHNGWDVVAS